MKETKNILILEDDLVILEMICEHIRMKFPHVKIFCASEIKIAQDTLKNKQIDIFVCDGKIHSHTPNTFPILKETKERFPHMIIIVWSADIDFAIRMHNTLGIPFSEKMYLIKKLETFV